MTSRRTKGYRLPLRLSGKVNRFEEPVISGGIGGSDARRTIALRTAAASGGPEVEIPLMAPLLLTVNETITRPTAVVCDERSCAFKAAWTRWV